MRRTLALIAIGLGAFLIVSAPLVKWYLAPRAGRVALDQYAVITSVSDGTSVAIDRSTGKIRTGLTVTNRQVVQGQAEAGSGRVAVWYTVSKSTDADGHAIDKREERIAFDRVSALAVNCCDEQLNGVPVKHEGLTFKFPFGTDKKEYPFYDEATQRAWPMVFKGVESVLGLSVYHFTQSVPATDVETLTVPPSVIGKPDSLGPVSVHRFYENVTDLLVEPTTGVIVRGASHQVQTLRDAGGQSPLATVADVNATYDAVTQKFFADQAKAGISQLRTVRYIVPIGSVILGLALVVIGLVTAGAVAGRSRSGSTDAAVTQPTGTPVAG